MYKQQLFDPTFTEEEWERISKINAAFDALAYEDWFTKIKH